MITGIYKHYKGNRYEVIGIAHDSETMEEMVVYKALYKSDDFGEEALWVRPKKMFEEEILLDGKHVKRFELVGLNNRQP